MKNFSDRTLPCDVTWGRITGLHPHFPLEFVIRNSWYFCSLLFPACQSLPLLPGKTLPRPAETRGAVSPFSFSTALQRQPSQLNYTAQMTATTQIMFCLLLEALSSLLPRISRCLAELYPIAFFKLTPFHHKIYRTRALVDFPVFLWAFFPFVFLLIT